MNRGSFHKDSKKSKYKYVREVIFNNSVGTKTIKYKASVKFIESFTAFYDTEREAAIAVDLHFIKNGKSPVNILKPKI